MLKMHGMVRESRQCRLHVCCHPSNHAPMRFGSPFVSTFDRLRPRARPAPWIKQGAWGQSCLLRMGLCLRVAPEWPR